MIAKSLGIGARSIGVLITTILMLSAIPHASATTSNIVALGASNTAGKGVGAGAAWPARLEAMLRAKGYDVTVRNAGINGDDTSRMLARVDSAVPDGTQLVILDKAASNDRKRGTNTNANIAAIVARLRARGIRSIVIAGMHDWANNQLQADGIHITAAGHAAVAARLLPLVIAAIGPRARTHMLGPSPRETKLSTSSECRATGANGLADSKVRCVCAKSLFDLRMRVGMRRSPA